MNPSQSRWLHRVAVFVVMISAAGVAGAQAAPALANPNGGASASSCKAKVATLKELKVVREKQINLLRKELGLEELAPPPAGSADDKTDRPGMHPVSPPPSCTSQRRTLDALITTYDSQIARLKQQVADKKSAADAGRG